MQPTGGPLPYQWDMLSGGGGCGEPDALGGLRNLAHEAEEGFPAELGSEG